MTLSDSPRFKQLVSTLAEGRGKTLSPANLDGLWTLLEDLPFELVHDALIVSAREDRFFPSADLVRRRADDVRREQDRETALQRAPIQDGTCCCDMCEDTGFRPVEMATMQEVAMGELAGRAMDSYRMRPCACRGHNRAYQAKRANEQRQQTSERGSAA